MIARHVPRRIPASQRRRIRTAAAVAGVSVLIAGCSRDATTCFVPDAYHLRSAPATGNTATATDHVLRDYRNTVIKLYGPQPTGSNAGE